MTYTKALLVLCIFSMAGCASDPHKKVGGGKPVVDIYRSSGVQAGGSLGYYPVSDGDLKGYTRSQDSELDSLFPKLPNPTVYLYSFPHITESGLPVPGYTTEFPLYENAVNYALPHEAQDE